MSDLAWQKSSFSDGAGANCLELAASPAGAAHHVHIRESDAPGVVLTTTPAALAAFIGHIKAGAYDPAH